MTSSNSHYFYSDAKPQHSIKTILILLFLLAQTASLMHAAVHNFHDPDEYCDTFQSLEKHHYIVGVVATPVCHILLHRAETTFRLPKTSLHSSQFYEARASPARSTLLTITDFRDPPYWG
ncbi:MAG: hypothetical protein P8101_07970 [Candidatus Thiodiazotropha sp.]|jgi:hypothetical protein